MRVAEVELTGGWVFAAFGAVLAVGCEGRVLPLAPDGALPLVVLLASAEVRPTDARAAEVFTTLVGARGVPLVGRRVPASARVARESDLFDFPEDARLALGTCMAVTMGLLIRSRQGQRYRLRTADCQPLTRCALRKWRR